MEYFDLYTANKETTGEIMARGNEVPNGTYHLIVFVCIFNDDGKMLIQQRQLTKSTWPGIWDVSAGGSVLTGETSLMAAKREAEEELGVKLEFEGEAPALSIYYEKYIHDIYIAHCNQKAEDFDLQEEEVRTVRWSSKDEIREMIKEGSFISVYEEFIDLMFCMQKQRGIMKNI